MNSSGWPKHHLLPNLDLSATQHRSIQSQPAPESSDDVAKHAGILCKCVGIKGRHDAPPSKIVEVDLQVSGQQPLALPISFSQALDASDNDVGVQSPPVTTEGMAAAGLKAMHAAGVCPQQIKCWIPHQANLRLIRETGRALGIPSERTATVIDRYANSSAATIPIALTDAIESGSVSRGDLLLLTAVGAGMTTAGVVLKY